MRDDCTFDEATHTYRCGERPLVSVTQLVGPLIDYSMVDEDRLAYARDRGIAVDIACNLDDDGTIDDASVNDVVRPYLDAYRQFKLDFKVKVLLSQQRLYWPELGYAGTLDKVFKIGGDRVLVDVKCTAEIYPAVGVQLGGYEALLDREKRLTVGERWALQLRRDGKYRRVKFDREVATFMSLLNLHNWRVRNGLA